MAEQKIELRKIRDFSEIISDTFVFITQNLKPLLVSFLGIAGVFMLAEAIISGIYQSGMGDMFREIFSGTRSGSNPDLFGLGMFSGTYFLLIFLSFINMVAMKVSIIAYMKVYDAKETGSPTFQEVWNEFSRYCFKVFFFSLPIMVLIFLGLCFCIAPGVYLWVVFVPFEVILMVEDKSFGDAFNRCFTIIKQNFWPSLGIYLVAYLIYYFCSLVVGGMMAIIGGGLSYLTTKDISGTIGIFTSVLSIFSFVFFVIYYVAAVLNYFSLTEKFDGSGMLKKLDRMGSSDHGYHNTEEQY